MSWESGRPIYDRLPGVAESFRGNQVVDWLTSFWDEMLTGHKANLDQPEQWLGASERLGEYFLDWVGIGLCGYGQIWDYRLPDDLKRRMIEAHPRARFRQSATGLSALVQAIVPGSRILSVSPARADFDFADLCVASIPGGNSYQILVPTNTNRGTLVWAILERILRVWAPVGESRVQHELLTVGTAIAGDVCTSDGTYGYLD